MTDIDKRAWEELLGMIGTIGIVLTTDQEKAILAADAELKRLREEVSMLHDIIRAADAELRRRAKEGK